MGIDLFTGGNHIFDKQDVKREPEIFSRLAIPSNVADGAGVVNIDIHGIPLSIVNLVGKVFMPPESADPFTTFDQVYERYCKGRRVLVDFHAEATSEKVSLAEYIGDRAFAIIGTHTHVQTADERILKSGAFFISDVGACCAQDSALGMNTSSSIARFCGLPNQKLKVELEGALRLNAIELTIDSEEFKIVGYQRVNKIFDL
jgi:calcineurin-like phosphoesterase